MEENNRKGPGVFYAVVGVATLVVAIIGATFAYFSASATDSSAMKGTTAEAGGIELVVSPIESTSSNMIPLNLVTGTADPTDQFASAMNGKCVDSNGNHVCQVYSITVTNKSTTSAVQVRGTLNLASETTNMKWQLLSSATATERAAYATVVDKAVTGDITVGGNTGATGTAAASQNLTASGTATYYVLVWLEETGDAQETQDAAKGYTGTVTFNAVNAAGQTSGVTASFTS